MKRGLLFFVLLMPLLAGAAPADTTDVVNAINGLGLDLYHAQSAGDGNLLFSPYSIQNALAMTYAGAAGDTRAEMQRVLHYPTDENSLHAGFAELAGELAQIVQDSAQRERLDGKPCAPIELHLANRLFVQSGYQLREEFLSLVQGSYGALPEQLDFAQAPEEARMTINQWAEDNTKGKIRDLIPPAGFSKMTRLAIANAVYLHSPWDKPFEVSTTKSELFFIHPKEPAPVPTMWKQDFFNYKHYHGFTVLTLPYTGGGLQFLILLPDKRDGLPALERKITPELLTECAKLPMHLVIVHLPKFKLSPPTILLEEQLQKLGMKTAFDEPAGSANFDPMAPRKPDGYLAIGHVFHKAFLSLDEDGTEAAAATVVAMETFGNIADNDGPPPKPIEVRVDHPFIFAIQHVPSGECLFLGRVTDPR